MRIEMVIIAVLTGVLTGVLLFLGFIEYTKRGVISKYLEKISNNPKLPDSIKIAVLDEFSSKYRNIGEVAVYLAVLKTKRAMKIAGMVNKMSFDIHFKDILNNLNIQGRNSYEEYIADQAYKSLYRKQGAQDFDLFMMNSQIAQLLRAYFWGYSDLYDMTVRVDSEDMGRLIITLYKVIPQSHLDTLIHPHNKTGDDIVKVEKLPQSISVSPVSPTYKLTFGNSSYKILTYDEITEQLDKKKYV